VIQWGYGVEGGGSYTDHELATYRWTALGLALPLFVILGALFVARYGQSGRTTAPAKRLRFRWSMPPIWSHIPLRLPTRWSALIWLELRQSVPLVVCGLLFALLVALASVTFEPQPRHSTSENLRAELPHAVAFVGVLWAAVVGSGLYASELGSGLGAFWRSRPISPGMWFWSKFLIGLVAILVVLDGVTVWSTWTAHRDTFTTGMSRAYVGCFPIIHALLYALAVFGTCWLRKPVVGGLLAILGYAVLTMTISTFPITDALEPINVYNRLLAAERAGQLDFSQSGYPLVYGVLAGSVLLLAVLASRAARPLEEKPSFRWTTW
jgi:hypothetical protein